MTPEDELLGPAIAQNQIETELANDPALVDPALIDPAVQANMPIAATADTLPSNTENQLETMQQGIIPVPGTGATSIDLSQNEPEDINAAEPPLDPEVQRILEEIAANTDKPVTQQNFDNLKKDFTAPIDAAAQQRISQLQKEQATVLQDRKKIEEDIQKLEQDIASEDNALKEEIKANSFFGGDNLGRQIAVGLSALVAGAYGGRAGDVQAGSRLINNIIDRDLRQQQLTQQQYNARKSRILDLVKLKTSQLAGINKNNTLVQQQAQSIMQAADAQKSQIQTERLRDKMINGALQGLPPEQFRKLMFQDPEIAKQFEGKTITIGGKTYVANEKLDQAARQSINTNLSAIKDLGRLIEIAEMPLSSRLDVLKTRPEAETLSTAAIGALRLVLFGPGVLTDSEQKLARKIIRNPTDIFSLPSANKTALNSILEKVKYANRQELQSRGVALPPSINEQNINQLAGKGRLSRAKAINVLVESNLWKQDEDL